MSEFDELVKKNMQLRARLDDAENRIEAYIEEVGDLLLFKDATMEESARRGLTLATLCDMVLEEDAEDRSDDALIRRIRELLNANCAWDNTSSPDFDGCNGCEYACAVGKYPPKP